MNLSSTRKLVIPTFVRRAKVTDVSKLDSIPRPGVDIRYAFHNFSEFTVYVSHRNGVCEALVPSRSSRRQSTNEVVVRVEHCLRERTEVYVDRQIVREGKSPSAEAAALQRIGERTALQDKYRVNDFYFALEYTFDVNEIADYPHGLYSPELDVMFTYAREHALNNIHPNSELGIDMRAAASAQQVSGVCPFSFYIVDHDSKFTKRYLRFGAHVYDIPILTDIEQEEGFHVVTPFPCDDKPSPIKIRSHVMSMEEADKTYPIYRTLEDAKLGGQEELDKLDKEFRNQTNRAKEKELEIKEKELEYKREVLENDKRQRLEDKLRKHEDDIVRQRLEQRADKRAMRTDLIEIAKTTATIITSLTVIYKTLANKK